MATQLKDLDSIERIISEMSLEEKAKCIIGGSLFYTKDFEKYGIPKMLLLDGGTGVNTMQLYYEEAYLEYVEELKAKGGSIDENSFGRGGGMDIVNNEGEAQNKFITKYMESVQNPEARGCYPPGMTLAATWNPEVIEECGHALGKEANAAGIDVLLGTPNVNISRDPLNGRLFEGYGEDPCLVSKLAPHFASAVQDEGVIANVKHFAANNQETDRMGVNEIIPERALREIYLPGFKAVADGGCKTVMSAYNKINGVPCAQNRWLLHDVLKDEWGYKGFVMSDWSAAYDQVEACAAGNDLVMPGPRDIRPILAAIEDGSLKEEQVDECIRNILRVTLDSTAFRGGRPEGFDVREGVKAAYDAAAEAVTLLKNDGVLPLAADAKPAFYGKYSKNMIMCGAGSAEVSTSLKTNIFDCAVDAFGEENITFETVTDDTTAVIVTVGSMGQEGADRQNMLIDADDRESLDAAVSAAKGKDIPVVVILNVAGPVQVYDWEKDVSAILCIYLPGMQGGAVAVDALTGKVNPSGRLPVTFPRKYKDCPTYGNFPGYNEEVFYGEGIYVGYRYYEKKEKEADVMYPFGFGLSYTDFEITGADAPSKVDLDSEDVEITVSVKNTGGRAGAEVVQLYVGDVESILDKPVKELKAFRKVLLLPGEERQVSFVLKKDDFASYDIKLKRWVTEPGEFRLYIGSSSRDISFVLSLDATCDNPYKLGPDTDIIELVGLPDAVAAVKETAGVDLAKAAYNYIVFQPRTPFIQIWNDIVVPSLNVDEETAEKMLSDIYEKWEGASTSDAAAVSIVDAMPGKE